MSGSTQLVVLGGGPGGYTAAFRAADLGMDVTLVERYPVLGGICLNVGCIPSKALLHAARVIEEAKDLGAHGLDFGQPRPDLDKLRAYKQGVVDRLNKGLAQLAAKRKVRVVTGVGRLTGPHELEIDSEEEGKQTLTFEQAILAAGSRSLRLPDLPDDERIMSSTGALELPEVPPRLLVIGGGIIGLEMACVYASLGSQITVVELTPGLMPGCDRDLVRPLERRLAKRFGAEILLATKVTQVHAQKNGLKVGFEGERAPDRDRLFDRILLSVGRRPNGDQVGAEAAGVAAGDRGFIGVDTQRRTNVPHIFAIGDLVPGPMLAHKATHEGKVAAEAAAGEKSHFDARAIPSVAFTDPEIAWVGPTETEAKANGTAYEVGRFPWAASGRALGMGRDDGATKLLFDPESKRILGGGIVGPGAGDLISEVALAIEMGCEAADLGLTVHPHPTLSETVAFAAEAFAGTLTDL
ncbi:MAG: dihydrolipoyl dehydrogenase [Thermoanaerobaculia bacterium]